MLMAFQHSISEIESRMELLGLDEPSPPQAQDVDRAAAVSNNVCSLSSSGQIGH